MRNAFVLLFAIITIIGNSQTATTVNKHLKITVPVGLKPMTESQAIQRNQPKASYADETNQVILAISERSDTIKSDIDYKGIKGKGDNTNIALEKEFYKATLAAMYEDITFIQDTIIQVDETTLVMYQFDAVVKGKTTTGTEVTTRKYNFITHAYKGKKKFIVTFYCPLTKKDDWIEIIQNTMKTIEL